MVLSILIATISAPGLLGSQEAIRQSQSNDKREEHRARRCNLIATCVKSSRRSRELDGRPVVLKNGRLWIDTGTEDGSPLGHPYAGYYLPYPDTKYEGLVTTITDEAPVMNWVYVDKDTHQVRYGVRDHAQPNLTGPFDCTRQDRRLTFDGWEGWCAVEEAPGCWALYFDVEDDGLTSKVTPGTKVLELELSRKEKRFAREKEARNHDQATKRAVHTDTAAPIDKPIAADVLVSRPGVVDFQMEKGSDKPGGYKPLKIPKSIFEDPPPIVAPLVFRPRTPKTPPPAYSPEARHESFPAQAMCDDDQSGPGPEADDAVATALRQPTENIRPTTTSKLPVPLATHSTPGPMTEKRTVRKRSSGTKALAQAQMFEALAAGRERKPDERAKDSLPSPLDRVAMGSSSPEHPANRKVSVHDPASTSEAPGHLVLHAGPLSAMSQAQAEELYVGKSLDENAPFNRDAPIASTASEALVLTKRKAQDVGPESRRPFEENVQIHPDAESSTITTARIPPGSKMHEEVPSPDISSPFQETTTSPSKVPSTIGGPGQARPLNLHGQQASSMARRTQPIPSRIPPPRQDSTLQRKRSSSEMLQSSTPSRSPTKAPAARTIREPARASLTRSMTTGTRIQGMANRLVERRDEARPSRGRLATIQSTRNHSRGVLEQRPASALLLESDERVRQGGHGPVETGGSGRRRGNSVRRAATDDEGKSKWT